MLSEEDLCREARVISHRNVVDPNAAENVR
jgi:hypothetical protein